MNTQAIANAIRTKVAALAASQSFECLYENDPADVLDEDGTPAVEPPFVQCWILFAETTQTAFGGSQRRYRTPGTIKFQVYGVLREGTKDIHALAEVIAAEFRTATVGGVHYQTPSVRRYGRDGNWWRFDVDCQFYADHIA